FRSLRSRLKVSDLPGYVPIRIFLSLSSFHSVSQSCLGMAASRRKHRRDDDTTLPEGRIASPAEPPASLAGERWHYYRSAATAAGQHPPRERIRAIPGQ